jgi:hypothetical protein
MRNAGEAAVRNGNMLCASFFPMVPRASASDINTAPVGYPHKSPKNKPAQAFFDIWRTLSQNVPKRKAKTRSPPRQRNIFDESINRKRLGTILRAQRFKALKVASEAIFGNTKEKTMHHTQRMKTKNFKTRSFVVIIIPPLFIR